MFKMVLIILWVLNHGLNVLIDGHVWLFKLIRLSAVI